MERTRALATGPLAGWAGRLLLLGAVLFWWGGVVVLRLIDLAFPEWRVNQAILSQLDASGEGTLANSVSAAALLAVALLAGLTAVVHQRRRFGRVIVGGWTVLALTTAGLGIEELAESKSAVVTVADDSFGYPSFWPFLVGPLVGAFLLAMTLFLRNDRQACEARTLLALGIVAWLLVLPHEVTYPFLFSGRADVLGVVLEETLEFGGTLLIGLGAAVALRGRDLGLLRRRLVPSLVAGSLAAVALLGGLAGLLVYRAPLLDARLPYAAGGGFFVALHDEMSAIQELHTLELPVRELKIRLANQDLQNRPGTLTWRVINGGIEGEILREGVMKVPTLDYLAWHSIDFNPPLSDVEGRHLGLQLVADVEDGSHIRIAATQANLYPEGRLWVNGEPTYPGQNLEFVAYGAPEPTRSKAQSMWRLLISDWRWPVLFADLGLGLMLVTLIPMLLIVAVWRRPYADG